MLIAQLEPRADFVPKEMLPSTAQSEGTARCFAWLLVLVLTLGLTRMACGQTASSEALMGVTLDPSGAVLGCVSVNLTREDGTEARSVTSDQNGRFSFLLLRVHEEPVSEWRFDLRPPLQNDGKSTRRPVGATI